MSADETLFGSVCSGIEAASVAWHELGWRAAWLAEIDKFASAVLAHHYPEVPNLGDMTKIARAILIGNVPAPDVLCGGTPCQAFSVAGLRNSLDDARGNLTLKFVEIANAIDHVRIGRGEDECVVVWENVPGVLSTKDNAFGCFLAGLAGEDDPLEPPGGKWANAGAVYGPRRAIAWRTMDAQYFGLPQRRRRVFVVASARDGLDPAAVLFEWDGVRRDTAPSRQAGKDLAGSLRASAGKRGGVQDQSGADGLVATVPTLDASYGRLQGASGQDANHGHSHLIPTAFGGNNQSGPIDVATARNACASASGRMDFESETFLVQPTHTLRGEGFDASEDGTGRGTPLVPVAYATKLHNTSSNQAGKFYENYTASLDANSPPPAIVFDTTQITSKANYSNPQPGDPCHPLAAGAHPPAIAFDCKASGQAGFGVGEIASTMRAMGHAGSHSNGGGHQAVAVAVAFQANSRDEVRLMAGDGSISGSLAAEPGSRGTTTFLATAMQVRRLTPEECEALQGFPRGYTDIPVRPVPAKGQLKAREQALAGDARFKDINGVMHVMSADGPRYKALGNSWAVPNVTWIGRRIDAALRALP